MWGILLEDSRLSEIAGGTGYFFAGLGVHALLIVPELKNVLVLRMDTENDFSFPDRAGNRKLYQMIRDSRIEK